jgi:UTP:GlnB (protein PII) uridylyltransferase
VFAVLFHDVAKPVTATVDKTGRIRFNEHDRIGAQMTEAIMRRLRFSGAEIEAAVEMVRQHMVFKDTPKMRVAKLKRFMARPTFNEELELHRVDCESSHRMLDNYEFLLRKGEEFANEPIIPPPLLRGDDLIALGFKPGPEFGRSSRQSRRDNWRDACATRMKRLSGSENDICREAELKKRQIAKAE